LYRISYWKYRNDTLYIPWFLRDKLWLRLAGFLFMEVDLEEN
jgi:hypothetical protein